MTIQHLKNVFKLGCRHSSVDLSAPTILPPRVRVPSAPSTLLSFTVFVLYFSCEKDENKNGFGQTFKKRKGGSPGLVVMGRDSRSKGHGFESRHRILDGHFFKYICCKNCYVCLKRPKINEKEAGVGPF